MTPEQQRVAIAEACGYKLVACPSSSLSGEGAIRPRPMTYWAESCWGGDAIGLPDYLNDLNAMHEAEKVLFPVQVSDLYGKPDLWVKYHARLEIACIGHPGFTIRATAAQRCEAFLRTLGLWREGEKS